MADQKLLYELQSQIRNIETQTTPRGKSSGEERPSKRARQAKEKDYSSPDDAFSKIVALVNASDKSEIAIRERLVQTGFYPEAVEQAVSRAKTYGFIDDMRFASVLVRSRLSQGKGVQGIRRELRSHGIDIEEVPGWPEEFEINDESEFDRALAYLESHPPRSKNLRDGAFRKLVNKGFSTSVSSSAARTWVESSERGF